ncbi:MAG: hypothetical protein JXJ04_21045 [Spirochaetales bacterium]|nr:hypothetical protein [Spirochaetales bacterium]
MAKEEKKNQKKEEIKIIEVEGSEFFENELTFETGKQYKVVVIPEKFVFSL